MYCFIEAKIKDETKFKEYVAGHLPTIEQYGGRVLARTVNPYVASGDRVSDVFVIQQWPDQQAFMNWYHSVEYSKWIQVRDQGCDIRIIFLGSQ